MFVISLQSQSLSSFNNQQWEQTLKCTIKDFSVNETKLAVLLKKSLTEKWIFCAVKNIIISQSQS